MSVFSRTPNDRVPPVNTPRAIVASASKVRLTDKTEVDTLRQRNANAVGWQNAAWQCYDNVGEVNYAFNYTASILSRVRFHAAVVTSPDSAPIEVADAPLIKTDDAGSTEGVPLGIDPRLALRAVKYMSDLGKYGGMAPIVKAFGLNVQTVGECYLCCINDKWGIKSTSELKIDAGGYAILQPSAYVSQLSPRRLSKKTPIGRIWNGHPRYSADADSSLRAVISDCEELILLARLMRVTARSRLNAGILFIPDELSAAGRTIGAGSDEDDSENSEDQDEFEKELFDSMTAPVAQEDNAAAIVPMLVRGPSELGKAITYIQLARDVGSDLANRSAAVLVRVLQGINAPKELATGMSGSRYNNAQLIDEQSYKALVEPLALMFSDAVTEVYLRPMLRADVEIQTWVGPETMTRAELNEQIDRLVCWYDPSEVVTSVDQSAAADSGYDKGIVSASAWLKAHGFSDNDKPSEKETARWLALKQVAIPPNIQMSLFQIGLPEIFEEGQKQNMSANGVGIPSDLSDILDNGTGSGDGSVAPSPPVPSSSVPAGVS